MHEPMQARTEAGRRYVALMEEHAADFAQRAAQHDREGSFPLENFEALQRSKAMAAMVPKEFGGLGVERVFDMVTGISRRSASRSDPAPARRSPQPRIRARSLRPSRLRPTPRSAALRSTASPLLRRASAAHPARCGTP